MQNKIYTTEVLEDPITGDLILQLNEDLMKDADWRIDDKLSFSTDSKVITITNLSWQERQKSL